MEDFSKWPLLATIHTPADVRALPEKELATLADEIRDYLVQRVTKNGGHLASNLGVVELTLAIHRVFCSPRDHIIFDVGHQSYVHKLLTERKERFDTLRMAGGLSGFTKREESEYDAFGAGHSSTSISAAIGMAEADYLAGKDSYTVAVIGDGALTGGLAYEALNNCRRSLPLIIIINENEMSISPNKGGLARHLSKLRASRSYIRTKEVTSSTVRHIPLIGRWLYKVLRRVKKRMKHLLYEENLFEHMGIRYLGPIDGNDAVGVATCLSHAKRIGGTTILHVKTVKGKGYAPAETDPNRYHGLSPEGTVAPAVTFSKFFGEELCRLAEHDPRICAITAAMSCGTGLEPFRSAFSKRFFDVGIAEEHAITFAAGLAAGGARPVAAIYSTFLQRSYDQMVHDVALQRLPVLYCVDRAGLNAADGATHHGILDVALFATMPTLTLYAPVTMAGLALSMKTALGSDTPAAIRYPNGAEDSAIAKAFYGDVTPTDIGVRMWQNSDTPRLTILTHGRMAATALTAAQSENLRHIGVRVLLCEYLSPYDTLAVDVAEKLAGDVIFLEEEILQGGFGMNLSHALENLGIWQTHRYRLLATKDFSVMPHKGETIWEAAGVSAADVCRTALSLVPQPQ